MKLGAYTPEIRAGSIRELFEKASAMGFAQMQYNFLSSSKEEMPESFQDGELAQIAACAREYDIEIKAINGTFNMVDDDLAARDMYIGRFENIAAACKALDCKIMTLCTGSKSKDGMWRYSPQSASPQAWKELLQTTEKLILIAEKYDLTLGVETEASNAVFSVERTRQYLDAIASKHLKVIMDCANLFQAGTAWRKNVRPTIEKAFDQLGKDIVLAHAKDILQSDGTAFTYPGNGIVDYGFYFEKLKEIGYTGGLILHGIHDESEFAPSISSMRRHLEAAGL